MARSLFYVVTDDQMVAMRARQFGESCGAEVKVFTPTEWNQGLSRPEFLGQISTSVPSLSSGVGAQSEGGKVLPFPTAARQSSDDAPVATINELESKAIENAIHVYKGNLTEAAKALGIGRATLYRKVKQYNIDPQSARRKKVA
jgi:DNA-binding NtrC family response regulator